MAGRQYGRLSVKEYQRIMDDFREARTSHAELERNASRSANKIASLLNDHGFYWWIFYEIPHAHLIGLMCYVLGWADRLKELATTDNPPREFLKFVKEESNPEINPLDEMDAEDKAAFINLVLAISYSMSAIGYYSLSINELIAKARTGDIDALKKAVSVDRCALSTPTAVRLIARCQLSRDKKTLAGLFNRARNPHAALRPYVELRFFHRLFTDIHGSENLTPEELFDLVGDQLRLYSVKGDDPVKGLRERFRIWSGKSTI